MKAEPVSKRTRSEFREFLVAWTLREIELEFDSAGIVRSRDFEPDVSGQRRSLVEQYYHSLDFQNSDDVAKLLRVYESILVVAPEHAEDPAFSSMERDERRSRIEGLLKWLHKDGLIFRNGELRPINDGITSGPSNISVSELTRRDIIEYVNRNRIDWAGRLGVAEFLSRLYHLDALPSGDHRFATALSDIQQHTELNDDWASDWVFYDERFELLNGPDETFLRFLCEMLHPVVRPDAEEVTRVLAELNGRLAADGWEIHACGGMSGRPIFAARRLLAGGRFAVRQAEQVARSIDATYVTQQITRMEYAVQNDPELAIGTAKEFIETICKTILTECNASVSRSDDLPKLVKTTLKHLRLTPDDIPNTAKASDTIRVLLSNLASITKGLAELRNYYGSGHGKKATVTGLAGRHARLAVGAATTLGVFLFDTLEERQAAMSRRSAE